MFQVRTADWRQLCEAASQEHDSEKLLSLVQQLNAVLEERAHETPDTKSAFHLIPIDSYPS